MDNITLVIPAKNEKESLPLVLDELKKFKIKKIIVIEESDTETFNSIKDENSKILFQKNKGYGDAIILGISNVKTEFFCIFNADGSFNPNELPVMKDKIFSEKADFVFASRYEVNCSSEDDTLITKIGNYIFTKLGRIFFKLNITDILYTYVLGKTEQFKELGINSKDFALCVELPIKAKKNRFKLTTSKSHERSRISGKKKVNAIKDGLLILASMIKLYFN